MRLRDVFDSYKALPRASSYYCVSRCPDRSLVMVFKHNELTREGDALVHRSNVSEWGGLATHPTSKIWIDELNAGVKVARLGIRHRAGKFSAHPEMVGSVTRWDGKDLEVVFRPVASA
ncbi:MAG: hypothetical protein HEQ37_15715 [Acidovorax sp.]|nr:hypothetical protein [Acidovorax sp.]